MDGWMYGRMNECKLSQTSSRASGPSSATHTATHRGCYWQASNGTGTRNRWRRAVGGVKSRWLLCSTNAQWKGVWLFRKQRCWKWSEGSLVES